MKIVPMTRRYAEEYINWEYETPYEFYNIPINHRQQELMEILMLKPNTNWYAVINDDDNMFGFYEYELINDKLEIGLGISPEFTGKGNGVRFTEECIKFARNIYPNYNGSIVLGVVDFNKRAYHVYEKLGFVEYDRSEMLDYGHLVNFIWMRRDFKE